MGVHEAENNAKCHGTGMHNSEELSGRLHLYIVMDQERGCKQSISTPD